MTTLAAARPVAVTRPSGLLSRRFGAAWPLVVLFGAFPLWWVLGLGALMPLAIAVPLVGALLAARRVYLPPGFTVWVLFLLWVALGAFVLWADAPGAVPGGNLTRIEVFGYRLCWYLACTVVLVWLTNSDPEQVTWRRVTGLLGWMFVVTTMGGLLGVFAANIDFPSLIEMLLPSGIRANPFVQSLVHPSLADIQLVLNRAEPRPTAPFAFANSWGSNLALFLPFFVIAWILEGRRWQRIAAGPVLVLALVPTVYSLNRGLWACLAIGAAIVLGVILRMSRVARAIGLTAAALAVLALVASPLGSLIQERLANQHSNDRRAQLLEQTVSSALTGSPVVGFGSTRDVQGSFASIAGASTPECPACGVPPLGTQGHLWLVVFSQGLVGAAIFLGFFAFVVAMVWRAQTRAQQLCLVLLVFFAVQISVYDTLGMPLLTLMIGIGLAAREHVLSPTSRAARLWTWSALRSRLMASRRVLVAGTVLAIAVGSIVAAQASPLYHSTVSILLDSSPVHLNDTETTSDDSLAVTVDTEAALVFATAGAQGLANVGDGTDLTQRLHVTATPNSRALHIDVRDVTRDGADAAAAALASDYLKVRRDYLVNRRDGVIRGLREQVTQFDSAAVELAAKGSSVGETRNQLQQRVERLIGDMLLTPTNAGEIINQTPAAPVRQQHEVPVTSAAALGLGLSYLWVLLIGRRTTGGSARKGRW